MSNNSKYFRDRLINIIMILAISLLTAMIFFPPLSLLCEAFFYNGTFSFKHFSDVFSSSEGKLTQFMSLSRNTLLTALCSITLASAIGIPAGFSLFRHKTKASRFWILALVLAASCPLFVSSTAWIATIGNANWYTHDHWLPKVVLASFVQGLCYAPAVTLISGIAFASANARLEEEALLNSNRLQVFLKVNIPNAAWGIVAAMAFVYFMSIQDISITDTLRLRTYAESVYTEFNLPDFADSENIGDTGQILESHKAQRATAVSIPAIIFDFMLAALFYFYFYRHGKAAALSNDYRAKTFRSRYSALIQCLLILISGVCFMVPLVFLLKTLGSVNNLLNSFASIKYSLLMHLSLSCITAVLGTMLAVFWAKLAAKHHPLMIPLLVLIALPSPLIGIAIIETYNNHLTGFFYDSKAILVLAWLTRSLPYAVLILIPSFRMMPPEYEESARLSGANLLQKLIHIDFPANWRAVLAAAMLIIILSLSELGASFLVIPPGTPSLTVRFFTLIHFQVYSDAAGLCLITIIGFMLPLSLLFFVLWRTLEKKLG